MENLTQAQWENQLSSDDSAVIIDVRTAMESTEGMLAGAIRMDLQHTAQFIQDITHLDKTKNYYVYCRSGGRSGQACMLMGAKGLKTYNLIGGMMSWKGEVVLP